MSVEQLWYSSFSDGEAPHSTRYSRMPMDQQWGMTIDLAISFAGGEAGYRQVYISRTREHYWYWRHPLSPSGWWLIPDRISKRVSALNDAAVHQACHGKGYADAEDVVRVLTNWKRTGVWRRHVRDIVPRRVTIPPIFPENRRGQPRDVDAIRHRAAERRIELFGRPVYTRDQVKATKLPPEQRWAECDEGHIWIIPRADHDEDLDRCPKCGQYWQ